ncbi:MAG: hypothetical protein MJ158_02720 [Alphaproteobacteria bacterium]|nr:hypothetical protein [Alphaproteobacteria bacterium]
MMDKQKVKTVITYLLEKEAFPNFWMNFGPRKSGEHYGIYSAPSQDFDTKLKKVKIISPVELWHKYKFPNGFTDKSFERYVYQQSYIRTFDADRIIAPEKYIHKFFTVSKDKQKQYTKKLAFITCDLSDKEKEYIVNYFQNEKDKVFARFKKFLPKLKTLNPEIKDFNPKNVLDLEDLYLGMTSRFNFMDIKYFCGLTDMNTANKNSDKLESLLGFGPGFHIEPHRLRKLIDAIKQT